MFPEYDSIYSNQSYESHNEIHVCISIFFYLYYLHCKQCWVGLLYNTVGDNDTMRKEF